MKTRQLIKRNVPEKLRYFLRPFNYYSLSIYSCYYLKRRIFNLFNRPFIFHFQQTITHIFLKHVFSESGNNNISENFKESGYHVEEGRHCIYLFKKKDLQKILNSSFEKYPNRIGVKVIKNRQMSPDNTPYYTSSKNAHASNFITMRAVGSTLEKVMISNILSISGCAPRVYDLVYIKMGEYRFIGLIVQHIDGKIVSGKAGEDFIDKFKAILKKEHVEIVALKESKDFKPPEYNNNIIADSNGSPKYVDIQNFAILGRKDFHYPQELLKRFEVAPCFPDTKVVKRKEISYMSAQRLKNKIQKCNAQFKQYLTEKCFKLKESIIFDMGYPVGLMTGFALSSGAAWSYILDMDDDGKIAERYLFENGFSRFELCSLSISCYSEKKITEIDLLVYYWQFDIKLILELSRHILIHNLLLDCHNMIGDKNYMIEIDNKLNQIGLFSVTTPSLFKNGLDMKYYCRHSSLI